MFTYLLLTAYFPLPIINITIDTTRYKNGSSNDGAPCLPKVNKEPPYAKKIATNMLNARTKEATLA